MKHSWNARSSGDNSVFDWKKLAGVVDDSWQESFVDTDFVTVDWGVNMELIG